MWLVKANEAAEVQQILDFANKKFGNDVKPQYPFHVVALKNMFLFGVLSGLIVLIVKIKDYLIDQYLWLVIAWLSYVVCTSGVVYTILNTVPVFRFDQDQYGKMYVSEYFMRSSRQQYGGEGYIVSLIAVCVSAIFLFLSKVDVLFTKTLHRRVAILGAIFTAFMGIQMYVSCYRIKTPWYVNNFYPPAGFTRGPIMRDQGNNI